MRVLIVGGGGREHALAWKLKQEEPSLELLAAPGNPGIAELGTCVPIAAVDVERLARLAMDRAIDLTVVGPEAPLEAGIVDRFRELGLVIFGPTRAAAEIETSKAFAKQLMLEDHIPTARAEMHRDASSAKAAARRLGLPVVIKASGLAGGKGVVVCATLGEADRIIDDMLQGNRFGPAGSEVLVEEFMEGEEVSVFAITDGSSFIMLPPLQDHKRLLDNDFGPNTGGMGAYLPVHPALPDRPISRTTGHQVSIASCAYAPIISATLRGLAARGRPFTGLLYAGLMLTVSGPKVIEFNCRFGDPETQALMPLLSIEPGLLDLFLAVARSDGIGGLSSVVLRGACVATVLAAANYPETPRMGDQITLPDPEPGVFVFHAGSARDPQGRLVTAGGRVLAVSALAPTVEAARARGLAYASRVQFAGKQNRTDIGWREIAREQVQSRAGTSGD